jgi:hypothetical protein
VKEKDKEVKGRHLPQSVFFNFMQNFKLPLKVYSAEAVDVSSVMPRFRASNALP